LKIEEICNTHIEICFLYVLKAKYNLKCFRLGLVLRQAFHPNTAPVLVAVAISPPKQPPLKSIAMKDSENLECTHWIVMLSICIGECEMLLLGLASKLH
jgi:hypothetical protein